MFVLEMTSNFLQQEVHNKFFETNEHKCYFLTSCNEWNTMNTLNLKILGTGLFYELYRLLSLLIESQLHWLETK